MSHYDRQIFPQNFCLIFVDFCRGFTYNIHIQYNKELKDSWIFHWESILDLQR